MKIILAGGSGYLGSIIAKKYYNTAAEVVILTRGREKKDRNISWVYWDGKTEGPWTETLEGSKVVINLSGKSVNCRYNEKNKKEIIDSRLYPTLTLNEAINNCTRPPEIFVNAGSAAIFGDGGDLVRNENSLTGTGFSAEVCKKWEEAFFRIATPHTRKIFLRIGLVFGSKAWVLNPFVNLARFGLGGSIGSGNQYITWIHETDFLNLLEWLIANKEINGIVHAASPYPVTNREFMKTIRETLAVPFGLPSPALSVKLGAVFLGTEPELVLTGRRVVSEVLKKHNFSFKYPILKEALHNLLKN